jgi:ribosomal protein S18 acetylase RimI-like enzyme
LKQPRRFKNYDDDIYLIVTRNHNTIAYLRFVPIKIINNKLYRVNNNIYYHIQNIAVRPLYRGRGLCKKIINLTTRHIIHNYHSKNIVLEVEQNNPAAIKCYKKTGFSELTHNDGTIIMSYK